MKPRHSHISLFFCCSPVLTAVLVSFIVGLSSIAPTALAAEYFVSPSGSPSGNGSISNPWDLQTALDHPAAVNPGDTIWLRGGTYTGSFNSSLRGTQTGAITVRNYQDEAVRIDGGVGNPEHILTINGGWANYWGLEVMSSNPVRTTTGSGEVLSGGGINVYRANIKLINLIVHDTAQGIGFWGPALDSEIYGSIIYNNGWNADDRPHGHGIYTQNNDANRPKLIRDNIIFNGYSFGIHAYTEGGSLKGFDVIGNVWFNTGAASAGGGGHKDDCLIGGRQPAERVILRENMGWGHSQNSRNVRLGWSQGVNNVDVAIHDNYFWGLLNVTTNWQSVTLSGNTLGSVNGINQANYPDNTYLQAAPQQNRIFVRRNVYEPKRAHIIVYNWEDLDSVEVDVSSILLVGTEYTVRNAQNFFAAPVLSGTFDGNPLRLPMDGLTPAQPIGDPTAIETSELTGRAFNVFVLIGGQNTLPAAPRHLRLSNWVRPQ